MEREHQTSGISIARDGGRNPSPSAARDEKINRDGGNSRHRESEKKNRRRRIVPGSDVCCSRAHDLRRREPMEGRREASMSEKLPRWSQLRLQRWSGSDRSPSIFLSVSPMCLKVRRDQALDLVYEEGGNGGRVRKGEQISGKDP